MSDHLDSRAFVEHLRSTFELHLPDSAAVALELVEVTEGNSSPEAQQFSIMFRGPREASLPQGIYLLHHAELGELRLFLVPLGPDALGMRYEAVFNHRRVQAP